MVRREKKTTHQKCEDAAPVKMWRRGNQVRCHRKRNRLPTGSGTTESIASSQPRKQGVGDSPHHGRVSGESIRASMPQASASSRDCFSFSPAELQPHAGINDDGYRPTPYKAHGPISSVLLNDVCDQVVEKVTSTISHHHNEVQDQCQEIVNALMDLSLSMDKLVIACDTFANKKEAAGFLLALPTRAHREWVRHVAGV